jgi:type I restriction enzyme S subunit
MHWQQTRLKQNAKIQTGVTLGKVYSGITETRPYLRVANVQSGFLDLKRIKTIELPRSEALKYALLPNDVVLTEGGDIDKLGRGAVWSGQIVGCIHQNHIFAVRPDAGALNPRFLTYVLESPHGRSYFRVTAKQTTNLAATNRSTLGRFPLFLPPRPEQDQIVAYLSAQDAHIARYIKAKRDLIGLLTEQKLRIIDDAVTGRIGVVGAAPRGRPGADEATYRHSKSGQARGPAPTEPSGIEWLGEVPEHWEVVRIKYCVSRIYSGGTPETSIDSYWTMSGDGTPWLMISDVTKSSIVTNSAKRLTQAGLESKQLSILPEGTVLYTMYASIGKTAILGVKAAVNQAILGLVPKRAVITSDFLCFWLRISERHVKILASTSTQANLNAAKVKAWPVCLPPIDEQQAIVAHIKTESTPLDEAIARAEDEIALIREYRDRLIFDAVTGQVDLRGWQPGPDDVVSDNDLAALGDDEAEPADEEDTDGEEN